MHKNKTGLLLLNLGSPDNCDVKSVKSYLRTFLMDPRVIELPWIIRWILVNIVIVPFRAKQTAKLYQKVWTQQGSPLIVNTKALTEAVQYLLGDDCSVAFGMRYGKPSIHEACQTLHQAGCDAVTILPLFPQYSSAATGSAMELVLKCFANFENIPKLSILNQFYDHPAYIEVVSNLIFNTLSQLDCDYLLFSYHGLPAKFIHYREQCEATTHLIAKTLELDEDSYGFAFQSRLGKIEWLRPYTDEILKDLIQKNVKKLALVCPSFVSDCLETLEEINIGIRERWLELGGETFDYIPCLNLDEAWIKAIPLIASL